MQLKQLWGLLGGLQWLASQTRPDLAAAVSLLQQQLPNVMVEQLRDKGGRLHRGDSHLVDLLAREARVQEVRAQNLEDQAKALA